MSIKFLRNIFTFLIAMFAGAGSFAQFKNLADFQKIDEEKGLSDNEITCIYKDRNGFMWIGTKSGLNLLDGSTITVFKNIPGDTNSISNNCITAITNDSSGGLWIGTLQGLNLMNPFKRKFTSVKPDTFSHRTINTVTSLAVDGKNCLYIGSPEGLYIYDINKGKGVKKEIPGNNRERIFNNRITAIAFDRSQKLWLSTFSGLWSFNIRSQNFVHEISNGNDPEFTGLFTTLMIDHSGNIWCGTWEKGVKKYDPNSKRVRTYFLDRKVDDNVNSITEIKQPDGQWCLLINNHFSLLNPETGHIRSLFLDSASKPPVRIVYSTKNNWVWAGTDQGLYYCNPAKKNIIHHRFDTPITGQDVALIEKNGKILLCGEGEHFLKAYDKNLHEVANYSNQFREQRISCLSIASAAVNEVRCGTSEGIVDVNLNTQKTFFHHLKNAGASGTLNFITNLFEDSQKNWWLFPWRNGIWIADNSLDRPQQVFKNFIADFDVPKPLVISCAVEDKNGNMWFGDYDEGVVFYDKKTKHFSKPFIKFLGERNEIVQILYHKDYCYSFSSNSLLTWNVDKADLRSIQLPKVIDKPIVSIALDSIGNIWIATRNGMMVYNMNGKTFRHFTTADGLITNSMNGMLYCCADGKMIYACPQFISAFFPTQVLGPLNDRPDLQLTEVVIDGQPYAFNQNEQHVFDHHSHDFVFRWAVTDYNDPFHNEYWYKLDGIDNDWRSAGTSGEAEFASLSAGTYTLLLRGENANGVNARKILKLQFVIGLPFWKTWWFLSLAFIFAFCILYALFKYRLRQVQKIEKLRNNISLNLHDDIGSTLSSISILSGMALSRKKDEYTDQMLQDIKENSIAMMEKMDDIVWSIHPQNDSLENLFLRIKSFAARIFEAKGINYAINISEEIQHIHLNMEYRQHIFLIMKEAINNLVKYSNCQNVEIRISYRTPQLVIVLEDDGGGFDTERAFMGNGLNNMKKRAKEINADLQILSTNNDGTTVKLSAKIK